MNTKELDSYFKKLLNIEDFSSIDVSRNGLQVDNDGSPIKKIAFAVDANKKSVHLKRFAYFCASRAFLERS